METLEATLVQSAPPVTRLLVVEDDPAVTQILGSAFEIEGFNVAKANSVAGATAQFTEGRFDACIVDVHLPDGTGFDFLEFVRQTPQSDTPVIFVSGARQDALITRALRLGAKAYITKPFSPSKLSEVVRRWTV